MISPNILWKCDARGKSGADRGLSNKSHAWGFVMMYVHDINTTSLGCVEHENVQDEIVETIGASAQAEHFNSMDRT